MKWRVPGQEVDQRKLGERLWKKLSGMWIEVQNMILGTSSYLNSMPVVEFDWQDMSFY